VGEGLRWNHPLDFDHWYSVETRGLPVDIDLTKGMPR
jgi:hypothetical protein